MKIVFLQDDYEPYAQGGSATVAATFARGLAARGHDVTVITAVQEKARAGEGSLGGVRVVRLYAPAYPQVLRAYLSLWNPFVIGAVARQLRALRPDIVHAHNVHGYLSYATLAAAKRAGARVVLTAHDAMLYHYGKAADGAYVPAKALRAFAGKRYNPLRPYFIRRALTHVDRLYAVSASLRDALTANGIRTDGVLYNGIDPRDWELDDVTVEAFRAKHGLAGKEAMLIAGRLSGGKGAWEAYACLKALAPERPHLILLLAGSQGAFTDAVLARAEADGLRDRIHLAGWLSGADRIAAYRASAVVLVPSMYLDPIPTVNLEALVCGVPVVATNRGGSKEIIEDGVCGYIVDPADTETFAARVQQLLSDPTLRARMGEAGKRRIAERFSAERAVDALLAAYEDARRPGSA